MDPDLAKSVILLVRYDGSYATGLILNHPANVAINEVFPDLKPVQAVVYGGGPVAIGVRGLLRSRSKPAGATAVFGDVWLVTNKASLEEQIAAKSPASSFRIYAGYTGWSSRQLQNEIAAGLWHVLPGDVEVVFAPDPAKVWDLLMNRIHR